MKNKILKKYYFVKKDFSTYCGKCGKKQLQDSYNLKRHATECGFKTEIEPRVFEDGKDYAYSFKLSENGEELYFYVFSYNIKLRPGFKDRYCGAEWKTVFKATFRKNSKIVDEKGLYNIDTWMKMMIDDKHIPSLSSDKDIDFFKTFFTDILTFDSYGSFLDIYRNKGYGNNKILADDEADKLFKYDVSEWDSEIPSTINVCGELLEINSELILHIWILGYKNKIPSIIMEALVSNKYAYSKGNCREIIANLLCSEKNLYILNKIPKDAINKFDEKYPSFMINYYLSCGGRNILMPLFAANYNKCLELLYKAGIPSLAENFYDIKKNNELIMYKNNLKEIFGIPTKTLKKISSANFAIEKDIFKRLKEIYEYDPKYLSLENYGSSTLSFLKYQNITQDKHFKYTRFSSIGAIKDWTEEELFRTLKYLNKIEENMRKTGDEYHDIWGMYKDYLDSCAELATPENPYYFGKWPKDLLYAHDTMAELIYEKNTSKEIIEGFKLAVSTEKYKYLLTSYEDDKDKFEGERYAIYAPKKPYDLYNESAQMHNCVKQYVDKVANEITMIYFLRDKKCPSKSLCTIEVSPRKSLIQLKAYKNSMANDEIKDFVRRWAKIKGISFATRDIK